MRFYNNQIFNNNDGLFGSYRLAYTMNIRYTSSICVKRSLNTVGGSYCTSSIINRQDHKAINLRGNKQVIRLCASAYQWLRCVGARSEFLHFTSHYKVSFFLLLIFPFFCFLIVLDRNLRLTLRTTTLHASYKCRPV